MKILTIVLGLISCVLFYIKAIIISINWLWSCMSFWSWSIWFFLYSSRRVLSSSLLCWYWRKTTFNRERRSSSFYVLGRSFELLWTRSRGVATGDYVESAGGQGDWIPSRADAVQVTGGRVVERSVSETACSIAGSLTGGDTGRTH